LRTTILLLAVLALAIIGCSCSGGTDPEPKVTIVNGPAYFPMSDNDTWYYNSSSIIRKIDGDTTVNGVVCKRVFKGNETDQAWSITAERFAQHLLEGFLWFDPPLQIPLNMVKGDPVQFSSLGLVAAGFVSDADSFRTFGKITFDGYATRTLNQVDLDSCLKLDYDYVTKVYFKNGSVLDDSTKYTEYWAKGIGLLDDGDLHLDRAIINGVELPKRQ
jgi:hypothetical protein